MGYYIDQNGDYYEGDRVHWRDRDVPRRPSPNHAFDGVAWVLKPASPPAVVSMRQARRALLSHGLLPQVEQAIAAMPGQAGDEARIDWATATEVQRSWPLVQALGVALGLSDAQLDDLFRLAETL